MTQDVLQAGGMHLQHHLTRYDPTHIQQLVDDLGLDSDVARDRLQTAVEVFRLDSWLSQKLRPSLDGVQWRSQFMRQSRQELILEPTHPFGLPPGGPLGFQEQLSIGHQRTQSRYVVRNLGGADDLPSGVQNRRHRQRYVHATAVLAQAHSLESFYSVPTADFAKDAVLLRVKLRRDDAQDRLADHFLGCKPEESLRGDVPRGDDSL